MASGPNELVDCGPNDVAVPMNCGGRSSQTSLKFNPSPKDGILYWFAVMSSKKLLKNLVSVSVKSGAPGAGSGASKMGSWFSSTASSGSHNR